MKKPGEIIKKMIVQKGYTKRDITIISRELELSQPDKYSALSPQTVVNICKDEYINKDKPSLGIIDSIVKILWDGNWLLFDDDTGFLMHIGINNADFGSSQETKKNLFFEGRLPPKQAILKVVCRFSGADFLFESTGNSLNLLAEGQISGCVAFQKEDHLDKYNLVILNRKNGLEPAWFIQENEYTNNRHGNFSSFDEVFGKIVWTVPKYLGDSLQKKQADEKPISDTNLKSLNCAIINKDTPRYSRSLG